MILKLGTQGSCQNYETPEAQGKCIQCTLQSEIHSNNLWGGVECTPENIWYWSAAECTPEELFDCEDSKHFINFLNKNTRCKSSQNCC